MEKLYSLKRADGKYLSRDELPLEWVVNPYLALKLSWDAILEIVAYFSCIHPIELQAVPAFIYKSDAK